MRLKVFASFDGAIAPGDALNALFRHFGGPRCEEIERDFAAGALTAVERRRKDTGAIGEVGRAELFRWLDEMEIDQGFRALERLCREQAIDLFVLSDGPEFALRHVLARHGLNHLPVIAGGTRCEPAHGDTVRLVAEFPRSNAECSLCSSCKRNVLLTFSGDEDCIVYVGGGLSDACPVRYADVVFARGALQTYCRRENITYHVYRSGRDVARRLERIIERPRKRTAAEHLRREAFVAE